MPFKGDSTAALTPQDLLERLKASHFTPEGRPERIAKALHALEGPKPSFQLSPEMWRQIAEDPELEEL